MIFELTEDQKLIQQSAKEFAEQEIAPTALERDKTGEFPYAIIKQLGEMGFMGMMVPPEYGGAGLDAVSYALAIIEISKVDASVGVILSVNNSLVCHGLNKYGTEKQKQTFLTELASGKKLGAFALSEPEAGSDATQQKTFAEKDGGYYVLNGIKNWITNGTSADYLLVMAQTDPAKKHKGITTFIVEKGMPGFEHGVKEDKLGIKSSDTRSQQRYRIRRRYCLHLVFRL
ncbi:MAG TPA: acyl-CoA dehydrogenase family protein, partial [Ignavibacteriales bacterium]|nr:acyl-CoA dehydrogenase family protein [Ignavibacteriales bacterium]